MAEIKFTEGQIAKGFEEWERRHREDSEQFFSAKEKAELPLADYGKRCARYLIKAIGR